MNKRSDNWVKGLKLEGIEAILSKMTKLDFSKIHRFSMYEPKYTFTGSCHRIQTILDIIMFICQQIDM